jgi:RND family efflux transporter MFP subunit
MPNKKRIMIGAIIGAVIFIQGCSGNSSSEPGVIKDSVVNVFVSTANFVATGATITASGQVEAAQTANISTRIMGYITKMDVKVGDVVKQGQLLFTISSTDIQAKRGQTDAAVTQAEAIYALAQKDYERFTALYKQQSASAKELDNATLQYNTAKAQVDAAKQMRNEINAQMQYTNVIAPFSGIVSQKILDAGNMASPGMPVLALEQSGNLQVSAAIPETQIDGIKQGGDVTVNIKSLNKTFNGNITEISPSSQFTGGQYIIKISIPAEAQQGIYAGMYVNVSIPSSKPALNTVSSNNILVPASCIVYKDELTGLYIISEQKQATLRWVRLGKTYGDKVEVLSGLDMNEQFIIHAEGRLFNGVPVQVK